MNHVTATLTLYKDALVGAFGAWNRSWLALLLLFVASMILGVAAPLLAPLGLAGGFIMGAITAFLTGAYFTLISDASTSRRALGVSDVRDALGGELFFPIWVQGFYIGLPLLILSLLGQPLLALGAALLAMVVLNPAYEVLVVERVDPWSSLTRSVSFMQSNWPEWGVFNLVLGGLSAAALTLLPTITPWSWLSQAFPVMISFSPVGDIFVPVHPMLVLANPQMVLSTLVMLPLVHAGFLARQHLFRSLNRSSRRTRAWQSRMNG